MKKKKSMDGLGIETVVTVCLAAIAGTHDRIVALASIGLIGLIVGWRARSLD